MAGRYAAYVTDGTINASIDRLFPDGPVPSSPW
jgi:hypothetical protein